MENDKKLNLAEILKDCPEGTILYSPLFGEVELIKVSSGEVYNIFVYVDGKKESFTDEGKFFAYVGNGECLLFPSKDQRDWAKFKVKKERFDPHTFKPFDRVVVRLDTYDTWTIDFFSHLTEDDGEIITVVTGNVDDFMCIPFNEETAHLIGTTDDCPEYYEWWEE